MFKEILTILFILLFTLESFSTIFPGQTEPKISGLFPKNYKGLTKEKLIKHYGSEEILREILLSKGLPRDIDIDKNSSSIGYFLGLNTF